MNETNAWKNIAYIAICCDGKWKWFNNMAECTFFYFYTAFLDSSGAKLFFKSQSSAIACFKNKSEHFDLQMLVKIFEAKILYC